MALIDRKNQLGDQVSDLGLSCGLDGVSLAGTPLLRRTIAGLSPRRPEELAVLMKSAYGHDAGLDRLYRGLEVIAQALNRGDIGRAMVAAVQLKLPDLDEEGAAHIVYADEALSKYDSSEPRDERGRWTSGGGSPPVRAPHLTTREQSSTPIKSPRRPRSARRMNARPVAPDLPGAGMKPILVSDTGGHIGGVPIASLLVSMALTRDCIHNANEPRYYEKTQLCATVGQQCDWLLKVNQSEIFRRDACMWPDGSAAIMKFGVLVPFKVGHKF